MRELSAPLFNFGGDPGLSGNDSHIRLPLSGMAFVLSGPSATAEAGHLPVRGDLAHIRLAGRYFVPHYAVPMPHRVTADGATLRRADKADAEEIRPLARGAVFDVLDMSGGWAWGQLGEDGLVGYVRLDELEALPQ